MILSFGNGVLSGMNWLMSSVHRILPWATEERPPEDIPGPVPPPAAQAPAQEDPPVACPSRKRKQPPGTEGEALVGEEGEF